MPRITRTVKLDDPVKHGDQEIREVTLTTPDMGQMLELDKIKDGEDIAKSIQTIAIVSGLPPSVIKQFLVWDTKRIGDAMTEVMGEKNTP